MNIICQLTGISIRYTESSAHKVKHFHPVFTFPLPTLHDLAGSQGLSPLDLSLASLAYLQHTGLVTFSGSIDPAAISPALANRLLENLPAIAELCTSNKVEGLARFNLSTDTVPQLESYIALLVTQISSGEYRRKQEAAESGLAFRPAARAKLRRSKEAAAHASIVLDLLLIHAPSFTQAKYEQATDILSPRTNYSLSCVQSLKALILDELEPKDSEQDRIIRSVIERLDKIIADKLTILASFGVVSKSEAAAELQAITSTYTITDDTGKEYLNSGSEAYTSIKGLDALLGQVKEGGIPAPTPAPTTEPVRASYKNGLAYKVALAKFRRGLA